MEAERWTINDMSLPARKVITVWAGNVEVLVKQVEKGKHYAIQQVPETAKVARLIEAAPDLLAALSLYVKLDNDRRAGCEIAPEDWAECHQAAMTVISKTTGA